MAHETNANHGGYLIMLSADLRGANLENAQLYDANLENASFTMPI